MTSTPDNRPAWAASVSTGCWPLVCVYLAALVWAALLEFPRWATAESREESLSGWLCGLEADVLPFLPWIALAPLVWFGSRQRIRSSAAKGLLRWLNQDVRDGSSDTVAWLAAILIGVTGFGAGVLLAARTAALPPAYHDEYSYLFQAQTFAAGRLSFPSFEPRRELFDQMHVLNEGRFASRYFPGNGLWLLPFLVAGKLHLSGAAALGIVCFCMFWTGRELGGNGVGLLAGIMTAVSPGILLFSTTLLAHLPTLAGLSIFLIAMLRGMRLQTGGWLFVAGCGLSFAMLCRPMTAAGFALPWGVWFARWWLVAPATFAGGPTRSARTVSAMCLATPLVLGMGMMLAYNHAVTGSATTSPYQLYTDIYTPRHVYGFNNVVRGEQKLGPKVLENYDRWAENLTPELAVRNVQRRLVTSSRGTLSLFVVGLSTIALLVFIHAGDARWGLVAASIVSLHAAHVPYWFEGIMGWHYVFESAPLWLLLIAEATRRICVALGNAGRPAVRWCWHGLLVSAVAVNCLTIVPLWPSRLRRGLAELDFPRRKYAEAAALFTDATQGRPSIVFIVPDPDDRHMDYVTNDPALEGPILRARVSNEQEAEAAATLFPRRDAWVFDAKANLLRSIRVAFDGDSN